MVREEAVVAGHSKWAQIKRKKGATDAKRGQLLPSWRGRSSGCAGGPDPPGPGAPERDREGQGSLDAEGQHRAGDRARRPVRRRRAYETVTYEGTDLPGSPSTSRRSPTTGTGPAEVRHIFSKADGSLGESGSVVALRAPCGRARGRLGRRGRAHPRGRGGRGRRRRARRRQLAVTAPPSRSGAFARRSRRPG